MPSFWTTVSRLFTKLTTTQANSTKACARLTHAKECRTTLEQALHARETSFPGYAMRKLLADRAHEFVPGVKITLVPPEKDLIVDITSEELDLVSELLGGQEAWERAIRPKAADFKAMCQYHDPRTGLTHDWHIDSPYGKMFFPEADPNGFDQAQGLKSTPRSDWLTQMVNTQYGNYTNLAVYLRSIHHELLQDEQQHPQALILTDTAIKPQFCGDWSASDDRLAIEQSYGDDTLLKVLQELATPTDPGLANLLKHRFNKSYADWTDNILPKLNRLLAARFTDLPFTITLSLASFYDTQQQYLRYPASTQTNCWEWTKTKLVNNEGQVPDEAEALLSGDSGGGGLSFAVESIVRCADLVSGCRLSVALKRKR